MDSFTLASAAWCLISVDEEAAEAADASTATTAVASAATIFEICKCRTSSRS